MWPFHTLFLLLPSFHQESGEDIIRQFEECQCNEFPYLIGALYVYKGLLVIFGLFLAYESRNVKYLYLNDSRFVSVAMYLVVILIGITAPLSLVLGTQYFIDAAYGLSVMMIVLASMCCLLILFIPKVSLLSLSLSPLYFTIHVIRAVHLHG